MISNTRKWYFTTFLFNCKTYKQTTQFFLFKFLQETWLMDGRTDGHFETCSKFNNSPIKIIIYHRYLKIISKTKNGLFLDQTLRFKLHIANLISTAYYKLRLLFPHRHVLNKNVKAMLCNSIILSSFNYCDSLYGPCLDSIDIRRIQKVQNSCLRFIFGIRKYERISHKLLDLKWLNMANRRKLHAACLFHKIISNKSPSYLYNKISFRTDVHNVNVRFKGIITPP